jgi:D-alanyl-D-alanine carboxypeptidase
MSAKANQNSILESAASGMQRGQRLRRHPGVKRPLMMLLVMALLLAACVPITTQDRATAIPATATTAPATTVVTTTEMDAAVARVETLLDKFYQADLFSGVALIAQDGKLLWSKGWGMADRQQDIPNTPQTIFRIYGITLQFTAAAMLLLEQEGKLKLADPICTYLDDCPAAWQPITIHHLLSHTSGIPDYFDVAPAAAHKFTREGATPEQIVALFRDQPLAFAPGERREWSRSGFVLAGLIIERVSGQSYGDFVKQHLLEPLAMTHSGYGEPREGLALGYPSATSKTPVFFDVSSLYAAGGLYSTAEDLFRWNEALYNGQLLNQTQLQKMLTWHATTESGEGSGYGIVMGEHYGHKWADYAGAYAGYTSRMIRYLDDGITIVLIGNQEMDIFTIGDDVYKTFFEAK